MFMWSKVIYQDQRSSGVRAVASLIVPGWARVPLSSFFPQILIIYPIFPSNFTHFLPHFGSPGGRLAHPGRPWLRHCLGSSCKIGWKCENGSHLKRKLKSDLNQTWFTVNMGTFMIISAPCISVRPRAILFGTKRKLNSVQDFSVKCNGKTINNSSSVKYLGVNMDNDL